MNRTRKLSPRAVRRCLVLCCVALTALAQAQVGRVLDASTGRPIAQAAVVAGEELRYTDEQGRFDFGGKGKGATSVSARAIGYARQSVAFATDSGGPITLPLRAVRPKALYLSAYGIGSDALREDALKLIEQTELDALVIDVKGDRGLVPYRSAAVAAAGLAQPSVTVADMPALMKRLRDRGLYLIARVVVFKDDPYASAHPQWAVRSVAGGWWEDREGLAWLDPFQRAAWERSLALAEEAAQLGFDEVQFDYLRFPDAPGLVFSEPCTEERRVAAIAGFLDAAHRRLARYNVFISADIFGYVAWNTDDTRIGQQLESIAAHVDYLSPMLYPSGFAFGIPEHRDPMAAPFEIVDRSLRKALQRTGLSGIRFRPWLQAFRDYAFDHRAFGAAQIRAQIDAADGVGSDGWMLWNPHNRYADDGLKPSPASSP